MKKFNEDIIEKWVNDEFVQLIFLHKVDSIYLEDSNKSKVIIEMRNDKQYEFIFESVAYALKNLKQFRDTLHIARKKANNLK
jgi:hypothetical protein